MPSKVEAKSFPEVSLVRVTPVVPAILTEARQARERFYAELLKEWSEQECLMLGELLAKFNRTVETRQKNR